jgi:hypothetical protein
MDLQTIDYSSLEWWKGAAIRVIRVRDGEEDRAYWNQFRDVKFVQVKNQQGHSLFAEVNRVHADVLRGMMQQSLTPVTCVFHDYVRLPCADHEYNNVRDYVGHYQHRARKPFYNRRLRLPIRDFDVCFLQQDGAHEKPKKDMWSGVPHDHLHAVIYTRPYASKLLSVREGSPSRGGMGYSILARTRFLLHHKLARVCCQPIMKAAPDVPVLSWGKEYDLGKHSSAAGSYSRTFIWTPHRCIQCVCILIMLLFFVYRHRVHTEKGWSFKAFGPEHSSRNEKKL